MRLIDKEALCGLLADKALEAQFEDECTELAIKECLSVVRQMPEAVVRCRECKNYVIVDEFEGGKRYMCLVNHFSYLDNDGDNQFCSYGERKEGAD